MYEKRLYASVPPFHDSLVLFQNTTLSWNTTDPDLTRCFERTVLVWVPCVFLWTFSSLEVYYILHSKKRDIPWNYLNMSKLLGTAVLFVLTVSDLVTGFKSETSSESAFQNVDIYTPIIKLLSFVSFAVRKDVCYYDLYSMERYTFIFIVCFRHCLVYFQFTTRNMAYQLQVYNFCFGFYWPFVGQFNLGLSLEDSNRIHTIPILVI